MSRRRREDDDDGSSRFEWGGGMKGEAKQEEKPSSSRGGGGGGGGGGHDEEKKGDEDAKKQKKAPKMKLEPSGLLREEALQDETGAMRKYVASDDSAMPTEKYSLYPFKGKDALDPIPLVGQEWFLLGKDRDVAHIPTDHLTCSRQHAVIQFRRRGKSVVPYIIDLKSSNGTFLNKQKIESLRYYELKHRDVLSFAQSTREYVLLNTDAVKT